jgi:DNA-binding NtrC family response regulator
VAVEEFKRGLLASTLRRTGGNRTQAARHLGLQRTYLARLIRDLGVVGGRTSPGPRPDDEPADEEALPAAAE